MSEPAYPKAKLADQELRRLADGERTGTMSVIVELALPPQRVEYERAPRRGRESMVPRRIVEGEGVGPAEVARKAAEAEDFLRRTLAAAPVPLKAARAFAAEVGGAELRAILRSPLFKAVRVNRVLR